jgi:hypothetical protein
LLPHVVWWKFTDVSEVLAVSISKAVCFVVSDAASVFKLFASSFEHCDSKFNEFETRGKGQSAVFGFAGWGIPATIHFQ